MGKPTYQTCFGSTLSILFYVVMLSYIQIKARTLLLNLDWAIQT